MYAYYLILLYFALGEFPIDHILGCQPLEAVSKQFFSQLTSSIEDIATLLKSSYYECHKPDPMSRERHETFVQRTIPEALNILNQSNSSFLADFLFCMTGSRFILSICENSDFDLNILFVHNYDAILEFHTHKNMLVIPWHVYCNDIDIFALKLENAVENALEA